VTSRVLEAQNENMARPLRKLYPIQRIVRRRHRTWMASMTMATVAMAVLGATVVWMRVAPSSAPAGRTALWVSCAFSLPGLALGLLTLRGRTHWFWLALVPLLANAMLLVVPWLAAGSGEH
jgi:hypothetical protein